MADSFHLFPSRCNGALAFWDLMFVDKKDPIASIIVGFLFLIRAITAYDNRGRCQLQQSLCRVAETVF